MINHYHLKLIAPVLDSDYADYGGNAVRWEEDDVEYPDCSIGCRWAAWLKDHPGDWCVCCNPDGPRVGLLTFEHQAGFKCFERYQKD